MVNCRKQVIDKRLRAPAIPVLLATGLLLWLVAAIRANLTPSYADVTVQRSRTVAHGVVVDLSGSLPTRQTIGQPVELHLHIRSDITWPDAPVLYLRGIQAWTVSLPTAAPLGGCEGAGEEVPFVMHEQASNRTYIQIPPYGNCYARLRLTPIRAGNYTLSVQVYKRRIAKRDNTRMIDANDYAHPYMISRGSLLSGVHIQWQTVVGHP